MINSNIFITKNGLKVLLIKRPEKYTTGFSLIINSGSIYENKNNSGISHFLEHLFFNGTKKYKTEQKLREKRQEIGLSVGAKTLQDLIEIYGTFPTSELDGSFEIIGQMAFESLTQEKSVEKERNVIFSEISMRKDNNGTLIWDEGVKMRFEENCPLQLPIGGTKVSVSKITRNEVYKFYKKYCSPSNSVLIVGSGADFEKLKKSIENAFENFKPGSHVKLKNITNKSMTGRRIRILPKNTEQIYLFLSFPTKPEVDIYKAWKNGFTSLLLNEELNKKLRTKKGIVYDIYCGIANLSKNTGITYIQTSFHPKNLELVVETVFKTIQELKIGKIDMKTLRRVRETDNKTFPMVFDSLSGALSWVVTSFYYDGKIYTPEEVIEGRNKVTKNDLIKASNRIFDPNKLNVLSLGLLGEKDLRKVVDRYSKIVNPKARI